MMTYDEIADAAVELSADERRALIQALISSLDIDVSDHTMVRLSVVLQDAAPDSALHRIIGSRTPNRTFVPRDWKEDYIDHITQKYMHDEHPI